MSPKIIRNSTYHILKFLLAKPAIKKLHIQPHQGVLPSRGAVLIISNHLKEYDPILIEIASSRLVQFMVKKKLSQGKGLAGRFISMIFKLTGQFPVKSGEKKLNDVAMRNAEKILKQGGVVGIFPEGTRSEDGKIHAFRRGFVKLALTSRAPILPAGILYDPHPRIVFGELVHYGEYKKWSEAKMCTEIQKRVAKLSNQTISKKFSELHDKAPPRILHELVKK